MDLGVTHRQRHNPVDSICRKLQTIQRHDLEVNPSSPFQIPKFTSSSYDSPQSGLHRNLEVIMKKREREGMLTPKGSPQLPRSSHCPNSTPVNPTMNPPTPVNSTFTITSNPGEWRGVGVGLGGQGRGWQRICSTPAVQTGDTVFSFSHGPQFTQPEEGTGSDGSERHRTPSLSQTHTPAHSLLSYNLNFCSSDATANLLQSELPYPALVVKRLSMGDGAMSPENRKEMMAEVSLICEEDLLDTIFHACDTQRRGKVYVSCIVDYLRHTTSRGSEDSGLEDLCNMLDPEHKDVSIDLDTYHAIMKEWIDDCRKNEDDTPEDLTQESVRLRDNLSAKRSVLLNMTSGSLEAFGGEVSRADLETSDLVFCVSDLQFSNQKLQQEVRKLKQSVETMEDHNQKLAEENEELKSQARLGQQLAQKEKMLKDEVEEMKMSLSCTEEGRARASAQCKHMERENQSLIAKISCLQDENIKVTMEMDDLQKRMIELCDLNAELQVQNHSFDAVVSEKEALILQKCRQIEELKGAVVEYSSVTELLRADKTKLERQMHMMQPDLAVAGLSLSVAYRLNQSTSGSLQTELALAQTPPEGAECVSPLSFASALDETLDREVLLLLQGPTPDQMSLEFKSLVNKLKRDFKDEGLSVLSTLRGLIHHYGGPGASNDPRLQAVQSELDQRRSEWGLSLEQLDQYTDSLEKELIKMASNIRRSRTEILHLSVRVQEQENQKQQLREELDQLNTPGDSREASCQTPDEDPQAGEDLDWDEEFVLQDFLKNEGVETYRDFKSQETGPTDGRTDEDRLTERGDQPGEGEEEEVGERWTVVGGEGQEGGLRGISLLSPLSEKSEPDQAEGEDLRETTASTDSDQWVNSLSPQGAKLPECFGPEDTHQQAVDTEEHPLPPSHSSLLDTMSPDTIVPLLQDTPQPGSPEHDRTVTAGNSPPPRLAEMVSPSCTYPVMDETILLTGSPQQTDGSEREKGGEDNITSTNMSDAQKLTQDELAERVLAEDSTSLLPVLEEEEEGIQESVVQVPTVEVDLAGTVNLAEDVGSQTMDGLNVAPTDPSQGPRDATTPDPSGAKIDSLVLRSKFKKELELSHSMDVIEEGKVQEDLSETSVTTEKDIETSVVSEDSTVGDRSSLSPNDKEIEVVTEFQRLSLGFKCDLFTLEKRLRLEERSRDLAEENVRREVSSCQGLLQALAPLCEDDNQSMEIIQRLQKNLDVLIQSMTRVSSRSEMLGAIHQESRTGKAVEIMVQHVENLRRMYTKEHAELTELRENMLQNERSFGSHSGGTHSDDFRGKKQSGSTYYKASARRVSIAAIPRSGGGGGPMHFDTPNKAQDTTETEAERLTRRSPWNVTGKSTGRPPLKRFVSSGAWVETDEPSLVMLMKGPAYDTDSPSDEERREVPVQRKSSLTELGNKITALIMPKKTPILTEQAAAAPGSGYSSQPASAASGSRGLWLWLALVVVLAGLLALLASLVLQPAVDAAPVGTGDSWVTIQQLLWPYTGLRHNGQPPV
ncbi:inositol 1,4,5-triphosphate receptor associated 2 isoform X1 [Oncorhynchus mykiss]|uniref:inositol 1,4,5-triphosphate receptor associated 2 isoform X1 n=1 Tax=Oncorhynchus mykiss TaxID=8022 RepID=UPI001877F0BE|nr:inositol 1,4,5-triphosphate receptor associated 2 isoform X1 [Oncorhynchus mykiss]XP_036813435.1 inositol 1,4,5-triphosphate receptor associated 2 isoform X1 [Oncorhynchus mykiss]